MRLIYPLPHAKPHFDEETQNNATNALEKGKVIFLPEMPFILQANEKTLLTPSLVKEGTKNVSYIPSKNLVKGMEPSSSAENLMAQVMHRYVGFSTLLVESLFPHYKPYLEVAKTSYRPIEVQGRPSSYRKDDTRLHVDSFPSNPNQGRRILRVFSNVNPHGETRHWRLGEDFENVAKRFFPHISKPLWGLNRLLKMVGLTKGMRTDYDHYMLQIHNRMKKDERYQKDVEQEEFYFPTNTTWIVFTDQVSHAAHKGQYLLEQTFHVPVQAVKNQDYSPLSVLEKMAGRQLV